MKKQAGTVLTTYPLPPKLRGPHPTGHTSRATATLQTRSLSPASPSLPSSCELPLNGKSDPSQPSGVLPYARALHVVTPFSSGQLRESVPSAPMLQIKRWQQRRLKHSYGVTGRARILTHTFCPIFHSWTIWRCHTIASNILLASYHQQRRVHRPTRVYRSFPMICRGEIVHNL